VKILILCFKNALVAEK